jgi:hypothetical protein
MSRSRRAILSAAAVLLGLVAFQLMFGVRLVSAHDRYWTGPFGDMMVNLAGAEAVFRSPWTFPPTVTRLLTQPQAISIVYTDSLPWVTLALKALGLSGALNVLGLFLLTSYLLQPVAMIALMRACRVASRVALVAGAILSLLLPAWLSRQFGHIALTAHWIILASLALSLGAAREGLTPRRIVGFCLLAAGATGVHAYLLVTVALCFAAAVGSELAQRRHGGLWRSAGALLAVGVSVGASAALLGYGVGLGQHPAAQLGFYSMNLLGPVWPHPSRLSGQHWVDVTGWFSGGMDATGGQMFEGLNYLGGGILLLAAIAAVAAVVSRRLRPPTWAEVARLGPLAAALLLLALVAVGPKAYVGPRQVWNLPIPGGPVGDALALFRAHGRFFWACAYMILALALAVLAQRLRPGVLAAVATVAVAVQLFDVSILLEAVHDRFAAPYAARYPARLDAPAVAGRPWIMFPTYFCSDDAKEQWLMSQLVLLAVRRGGSANTANTARPVGGGCTLPAELTRSAAPGDRRITVALDRFGRHGRFPAFAGRADCAAYRDFLFCGAGMRELLAAPATPPPAAP